MLEMEPWVLACLSRTSLLFCEHFTVQVQRSFLYLMFSCARFQLDLFSVFPSSGVQDNTEVFGMGRFPCK